MHVFLDDYRSCPKGFVLATNAEECLLLLRDGEVDILSLDYELGPDSMNGGEVGASIVQEGLYPREIYLHTSVCTENARCTRCCIATNLIPL